MQRFLSGAWLGAALAFAAPAPGAAPVATVRVYWINPRQTVAVRTGQCGARICAWVVWATGEAKADASRDGVDRLIGTALLKDYVPGRDGSWSGRVYVPDLGRSFPSTIQLVGFDGLRVRGCLVGGFFCRSQLWVRMQHAPA